MGAAASIEMEEYKNLSTEQQEELKILYESLSFQGKTNNEIIKIIKNKIVSQNNTQQNDRIEIVLTDLLIACNDAIKNGKTPLVVDNSADSKVNTFISYRSAIIIDGKKMGLDKSLRNIPVAEIMEGARVKLVSAIKHGFPLIIALQSSVTDFATTFCDEKQSQNLDTQGGMRKFFPLEVFKSAGKCLLSEENMNSLFRDNEKEHGMAISRNPDGFFIGITTSFNPNDFEGYLFDNEYGLPKPKDFYQFIIVKHAKDEPLMN